MIFDKFFVNVFKSQMHVRCDDSGAIFYFSNKDFEGLNHHPFEFKSKRGNTLKGNFYWYDNPKANRIVVFDHGFGGGHLSYMREIETIAKAGYLVFSYDHTGCMTSEGENTNGLSQSLSDLDDCLSSLKGIDALNGYSISVIGHSWGGFSTMNIAAYHPDITHAVVISGFVSPMRMIKQYFGGLLSPWQKAIYNLEKDANPDFVDCDGIETLKNTNAKTLLIYSDNDNMVKKEHSYDILLEALKDNKNISLCLVSGKGHNPNYTADAVAYKDAFFSTYTKALKAKKLTTDEEKNAFKNSFNWHRMTAQDSEVWDKIFAHLEA